MAFLQFVFLAHVLVVYVANGQGRGALRLVRNNRYSTIQAYTSGIVEIYYGGWGNICDDAYASYTEANVICHQLGFTGVSSYGRAGSTLIYGTDTNSMKIEDVDCVSSSYLSLLSQCTFSSAYTSFCSSHSNDLYVVCYTTKIWNNNPYNGQIRLFGGTYSNQGRLEVYCNGQWGTVCDDTFGSTDAFIACRQLGYNDYSRYEYTTSLAGSSSQPIWLDRLTGCSSSSSCLGYCESCPLREYHDCSHSEDVTLECEYLSIRSRIYTRLSTCQYASPIPSSSFSGNAIGAIVGGVVAGFIILFAIIALSVGIPICICCYVRRSSASRPVTVTTATLSGGISKTASTTTQQLPPTTTQQLPPTTTQQLPPTTTRQLPPTTTQQLPPSYTQATSPTVQPYPDQPNTLPHPDQQYPVGKQYPNQLQQPYGYNIPHNPPY